jgi:hypothetical protein
MLELMPHQQEALQTMDNGRILYGGVGSGKSATAIAYYMKHENPKDIYVITTAKKRDSLEWLGEASHWGIGCSSDSTVGGILTIDSWNNIGRYEDVGDSFFIFDEQRLVGHGAWVKSFLRIAGNNRWILLSATPGDTWLDYAPVFIANGWYKNITDFKRRHVVYAPYIKFPKIVGYIGEGRLERLRNEILVEMPYLKHTERVVNWLEVGHDKALVKDIQKRRWHHIENRPIKDIAELWRYTRMVVNSDPSRLETIRGLLKFHPRLIVFYNFDYELDILRELNNDFQVHEWNGHKHQDPPMGDCWIYLVQYTAGSEGWNCTSTDAMAFYSLTYSYKNFVQAQGRIDRLNTSYNILYYYVLQSGAYIDTAIKYYLSRKKSFNEREELEKWLEN